MYIALCSVKDTEGERNTGFLSYFTAHSLSILSPPPFLSLFLSSSTVACVCWYSYRCVDLSGSSSWDCAQAGWLVSSAFCIPGKKKREQKAAESIGRQTGCARAVPVVWFWQLNWPQCCRCVMFKGRFKVMLSTGLAASDILNIYTFSVARWIIDWTCNWTCYKMAPLWLVIDTLGPTNTASHTTAPSLPYLINRNTNTGTTKKADLALCNIPRHWKIPLWQERSYGRSASPMWSVTHKYQGGCILRS